VTAVDGQGIGRLGLTRGESQQFVAARDWSQMTARTARKSSANGGELYTTARRARRKSYFARERRGRARPTITTRSNGD
jgi:hypothetical protein